MQFRNLFCSILINYPNASPSISSTLIPLQLNSFYFLTYGASLWFNLSSPSILTKSHFHVTSQYVYMKIPSCCSLSAINPLLWVIQLPAFYYFLSAASKLLALLGLQLCSVQDVISLLCCNEAKTVLTFVVTYHQKRIKAAYGKNEAPGSESGDENWECVVDLIIAETPALCTLRLMCSTSPWAW